MAAILYLNRSEIDDARWDASIDAAINGFIYAKSYYLDAMSQNWSAVITDDYKVVMPLPFKRKYGIRYVYMPAFTQQLGCFSAITITPEMQKQFLLMAQRHFIFGDYHFNYANANFGNRQRSNYILYLNETYGNIQKKYKNDLRKNLSRARRFDLNYSITTDYVNAIHSFKTIYKNHKLRLNEIDYKHFKKLCSTLLLKEQLLVRLVTDQNKTLLTTAVFLRYKNRIYLILSATTKEGRIAEANHFLLDQLIQEFAMQNVVLDFEGSDKEGIAHFYKNFGCINQPYFYLRWNLLPWPISLIKKRLNQ